jgi:hypothetical protein
MSIDVNGPVFKEWSECHATIGRMDSALEDLRKFGFTLITGLLTASAYLGFGTSRPDAGVAAFIAVMVLVTALFSVDTYYSATLSGAVERALDLEASTRWEISLTKTICYKCHRAGVVWVTLGLYVALLLVALMLGAVSASTSGQASVLVMVTAGLGAVLGAYMLWYWGFVARRTRLHRIKKRDLPLDVALTTAKEPGTASAA